MSYLLHYAPDNASLIVRLALDHLELPFQTVLVDRARREQDSPAYRRLNPAGLIPVLETPQGALSETGAILLWLADRHGGLGPDPKSDDRAGFLRWLFYLSNTLHAAERTLFYAESYIAEAKAEDLRAGLRGPITASLDLLDRESATNALFDPQRPGALHFYLGALLRWPAIYPEKSDKSWFRLASYPALRDLCVALEELPCTRALQKAEGLGRNPFTDPVKPNPPEGSAT